MFALPPAASDIGDLQPLADAIDTLCEILDGDRATIIEGLTEIVRKISDFDKIRSEIGPGSARD